MKKLITILFLSIFIHTVFAQNKFDSGYTGGEIKGLKVPEDALSFLVLGDWGRNGEFRQKEVATQMGKTAHQLEAEFIISTGDNFYPNGVASTQDNHWKTSFEDVYTAHSLMVNWHVVLGNHDYRGNPQTQIDYSDISRRWIMPSPYFFFEKELEDDSGKKALFIFLDTNPFQQDYYKKEKYRGVTGQDTLAQKEWLERILQTSETQWKIVIGHHPVHSSGKRLKKTQDMIASFEPLFEKYKVDAYFAGHEHDLQHQQPKTVHHFVSGAGSEVRPTGKQKYTKFAAARQGFMAVSLLQNELILQVVDYEGKVLYQTSIKK